MVRLLGRAQPRRQQQREAKRQHRQPASQDVSVMQTLRDNLGQPRQLTQIQATALERIEQPIRPCPRRPVPLAAA